jgi:hypothetical protein
MMEVMEQFFPPMSLMEQVILTPVPSHLTFPVALVVILNWDKIKELFQKLKSQNRQALSQAGEDAIGITLMGTVDEKNIPDVLLGIFNKKTEEFIDAVKVKAESIAPEVFEKHRKSKVVLYSN